MTTIEGTHRHATTGHTWRFTATYAPSGPTRLRWRARWWVDEEAAMREAEGIIEDAHLLATPQRAVIDCVLDAIDAA